MTEPDNFLSRWSRRKRAAAEDIAEPEQSAAAGETALEAGEAPAPAGAPAAREPSQAPADAEFDLSQLPPLDSIGPDTDVSVFLRPGVPSALRHAALRRVWTADPAIRDFKGLAENDWDFNDPNAIPGFGKLDADFDVRKMVAQVFGEKPPEEPAVPEPPPAAEEQPAQASQQSDTSTEASAAVEPASAEPAKVESCVLEKELVRREEFVASQQVNSTYSDGDNKPRRHGGALPQVFPEY
jgi:hypothetical protein